MSSAGAPICWTDVDATDVQVTELDPLRAGGDLDVAEGGSGLADERHRLREREPLVPVVPRPEADHRTGRCSGVKVREVRRRRDRL